MKGGGGAAGFGSGGVGEVVAAARVEDRPRRVDDQAAAARARAVFHHGCRVAALRADARARGAAGRRRSSGRRPTRSDRWRRPRGRTRRAVTTGRQLAGRRGRRTAAVGDQRLEVVAARVARPAEQDHATAAGVVEERFDRVGPHVRVDRDGVGAVAIERLAGVVGGGRADVAAFRVEDQRDVGIRRADVAADVLERILVALAGEVGDLRLERARDVGGGVDDLPTEALGGVRRIGDRGGVAGRIGVEPDAEHRARRRP